MNQKSNQPRSPQSNQRTSTRDQTYLPKNVPTETFQRLERVEGAGFPTSCQELEPAPRNYNDPKGFYKFLGVHPSASKQEIKKAFHAKAFEFHGGEGEFKESFIKLIEVRKTLLDSTSRSAYDLDTDFLDAETKRGLLLYAQLNGIKIPVQELFSEFIEPIVGGTEYSYYQDKGQKVDLSKVLGWYEKIIQVSALFHVVWRPRVAVQDLDKPYETTDLGFNNRILHFDSKLEPNFIIALAAMIDAKKIPKP